LEVNCALQVDSLSGLRGADAFASSEPPAPNAPEYFGNQFTDVTGTHWQEINLRTLSLNPEFLSISA
jgi:twitching motility protein PilI